MFVYSSSLRLSKPDEVDDVGEDLHESVVGGLDQVIEGKVGNATLDMLA